MSIWRQETIARDLAISGAAVVAGVVLLKFFKGVSVAYDDSVHLVHAGEQGAASVWKDIEWFFRALVNVAAIDLGAPPPYPADLPFKTSSGQKVSDPGTASYLFPISASHQAALATQYGPHWRASLYNPDGTINRATARQYAQFLADQQSANNRSIHIGPIVITPTQAQGQ